MKHFETTILNTYGIHGKQWLQKLPEIIRELQKRWHLSEILPVKNMTYHYVAMARSSENNPVVIKIGPDKNAIRNEASILTLFKGKGYVRLLDYCSEYNALLLEQATPGKTLKSLYPQKLDFVMKEYVNVVKRIDKPVEPLDEFPTVASWLKALDKANFPAHEATLLQTAISLKEKLITSTVSRKLLHGDLHLVDSSPWLKPGDS